MEPNGETPGGGGSALTDFIQRLCVKNAKYIGLNGAE